MIILNYHDVLDGAPGPYTVSPQVLRDQISYLRDRGLALVTLDRLVSGEATAPISCALTFDDGRRGALENALPTLEKLDASVTFFICTDFADGDAGGGRTRSEYMDWDDIRVLRDQGHVVGSHGRDHRSFFHMDAPKLVEGLETSKERIEDRLSVPCRHLAAPYGHLDAQIMKLAEASGYQTLSSTIRGPNKKPYPLLALRRTNVIGTWSLESFKRIVTDQIDALDVCRVLVVARRKIRETNLDAVADAARFDVVVCGDDTSFSTCGRFGLRCSRLDSGQSRRWRWGGIGRRSLRRRLRDLLRTEHPDTLDDRELMVQVR